jgi:hypothetical protein
MAISSVCMLLQITLRYYHLSPITNTAHGAAAQLWGAPFTLWATFPASGKQVFRCSHPSLPCPIRLHFCSLVDVKWYLTVAFNLLVNLIPFHAYQLPVSLLFLSKLPTYPLRFSYKPQRNFYGY